MMLNLARFALAAKKSNVLTLPQRKAAVNPYWNIQVYVDTFRFYELSKELVKVLIKGKKNIVIFMK